MTRSVWSRPGPASSRPPRPSPSWPGGCGTSPRRPAAGGDVGGLLPPLEIDAARFERDLIVGAAQRRQARAEVEQIRRLRDSLEAREEQLRQLATSCVATVDPAPRYAVPDVDALGPVPNTLDALAAYRRRLVAGGPGADPGATTPTAPPSASTPNCRAARRLPSEGHRDRRRRPGGGRERVRVGHGRPGRAADQDGPGRASWSASTRPICRP